jgi:DNA-binding PadR family transcriptional regulator
MTPLKNTMPVHPKMSPLHLLLLIQLDRSPKYGYEMLKSIKDEFEGIWEPKTGTIYPALKSLVKRELVETQVQDGVDFYHITPAGRAFLFEMSTQPATNMRFTVKFLATLTKWMSPELKRNILSNMAEIPDGDMNYMGSVVHLLNDDVDREIRLRLLKSIRTNFDNRLKELDKMIKIVEAES